MTTEQTTSSKKLLITGGSGFISIETIKQALEARHQVRTTIRSQSKQKIIIDALTSKSIDVSNLSFIQTDLLKDENWSQACKDIEIVLHIASPFPSSSPKNEDELIKPAVEGTLRVLKAAKEQKVKKVVVTSSIAAICFGNEWKEKVFTEEDWSDLNGGEGTAYLKSKTLAEKAVWEFYGNQTVESGDGDGNGDANGEDYKMEIAVVNPAAVFGPPIVVPSESTTVGIIQQMLSGKMPIAVDLSFGVVDVRDVASLHLLVAFSPSSNGQRYICSLETLSLAEIGRILQTLPDGKGSKAPTRNLPNPLVKLLSYVVPQLKGNVGGLGKRRNLSNQKAKDLGWNPRDEKETILSCAKALIDAGVV